MGSYSLLLIDSFDNASDEKVLCNYIMDLVNENLHNTSLPTSNILWKLLFKFITVVINLWRISNFKLTQLPSYTIFIFVKLTRNYIRVDLYS